MTIDTQRFPLSKPFISYVLHEGHRQVEGWIEPGALALTTLICEAQAELEVAGAFAEIGVHHGRFFIALCLLRAAGERAVAIDIFEDQHLNMDGSGLGSRRQLLNNIDRHVGSHDGVLLHKADSLTVRPQEILDLLGSKVRVFSVDGCHTHEHTESDIHLAAQVLAPGGVVIVDDIFNPDWPGVISGAQAFLTSPANTNLVPIIATDNKLVLCHSDWRTHYWTRLENHLVQLQGQISTRDLFGFEVLDQPFAPLDFFLDSQSHGKVYGKRLLSGMRPTSAVHPAYVFGPGWSTPESWGTWTDGTHAQLTLKTSNAAGMAVSLQFVAHAFLDPKQAQLVVGIKVNGFEVPSWKFAVQGEPQEVTIKIPKEWNPGAEIQLDFHLNAPCSPSDLGLSSDNRKLGMGLRTIKVLEG